MNSNTFFFVFSPLNEIKIKNFKIEFTWIPLNVPAF